MSVKKIKYQTTLLADIKLGRQVTPGDILGHCISVIVKCRLQYSFKKI